MLRIKTQFSTKYSIKTDPPKHNTTDFSHQKIATNTITTIHNISSPSGQLLHTDFNKIHDKNTQIIFLITTYPNNQNSCIHLSKKKSSSRDFRDLSLQTTWRGRNLTKISDVKFSKTNRGLLCTIPVDLCPKKVHKLII